MSSNYNGEGGGYDFKAAQLKSTQTLTTASLICAPVSLFIGGLVLSIVAIVCAGVAKSRAKALEASKQGSQSDSEAYLYKQMHSRTKLALGISISALALNIISSIAMAFAIMAIINSGDYSWLQTLLGSSGAISISTGSSGSIWS
jgi:hypothetical protein